MKKIVVCLSLALLSFASFAQAPLSKGERQLNAGFGFSDWGLPIYFGADFGVYKDITVGGELSFRSYKSDWRGDSYTHRILGISGNGNYHFNRILEIPSNFDFYAGLNLGFYIWASPEDYDGSEGSRLGLGLQVGGRYFFKDNFGINLEFDGGNAFAGGKFGITYIF